MKLAELKTKYADMDKNTWDEIEKTIQGETDAVRTEYSIKLKDLEQYKPHEKSETEKELEKAQNELSLYKFAETCKTKGINADLAKFLKSDADLDEFSKIFQSAQKSDDFVPNATNTTGTGITKEDFHKMNYAEKAKLYNESPELYSQLSES